MFCPYVQHSNLFNPQISCTVCCCRLPGPWSWPSLDVSSPQLLSWNANQPLLAVGHSSSGAVLVFNCTSAAAGASSTPLQQPEHVLVHQLQQQASSVAWRPVHSSMLAVGCAGGVALWNLGKLPLSAAAMSRGADGAPSAAAAWTTFLWFKANCRCGRLARFSVSTQEASLGV